MPAALGDQREAHRLERLDLAHDPVAAAVAPGAAASRGAATSSRTRSGNSVSSASTGVLSVFDIATWIALGPSASGQAPWPPPSVS